MRGRARAAAAGLLAVATVALCPTPARADIDGSSFARTQWGWRVAITGPKNWVLSEERSYPSVWLWMVRRDPPGKMLLSVERVAPGVDALAYARRTSKKLEEIGFRTRPPQLHAQTGAYWIDFDNGRVYLRQAFLVVGRVGYALTLAARDSRTRGHHLRAFDAALRSIHVRRAAPPQPAPPPAADPATESSAAPPLRAREPHRTTELPP